MVCDGLREEVLGRFEIRVEVRFRWQERFDERLRFEGQGFGSEEGIEGESGVRIEKLGQEMKAALLVCAALLSASCLAQQASTETKATGGAICVLPNSPEPPTRISPGGEYNPATLTLRIDKRESIRWPHKIPVVIDGLGLEDPHMVVLTSGGKRIQSFRFKFSEYRDEKLCIYYDGYQGVQLGNRTNAPWCKVQSRHCWQ
jgi:hypothetical protein